MALRRIDFPQDVINVKAFGARGGGSINDQPAIQAIINGVDKSKGHVIYFPPDVYQLNSALTIPVTGWGAVPLVFYGPGATLQVTSAISAISRLPANQTEAEANVTVMPMFEGLKFLGNQTVGQKGLSIGATYNMAVRNCYFKALDVGADLQFCLKALVDNCEANGCTTYGLVARTGEDWGGTGPNSPSNHTVFQSCRIFNAAGATAGFYVGGTSGVELNACIGEGGDPDNYILFDAQGATTVKQFRVINFHAEGTPGTVLNFKGNGTSLVLDGLFFQSGATTSILVDATDAAGGCFLRIAQTIGTHYLWKRSDSFDDVWFFEWNGASGQVDMRATSRWSGANLPGAITVIRANPSDGNRFLLESTTIGLQGGLRPDGAWLYGNGNTHDIGQSDGQFCPRSIYAATSIKSFGSLNIGGGTDITKHLSGSVTWDPPAVANAAQTTTTVTVTGAVVGNPVCVGFSQSLQGMIMTGYVSAADTVTVLLRNQTGASINLASGTLRADVWQH